jgi:hypothetical protein
MQAKQVLRIRYTTPKPPEAPSYPDVLRRIGLFFFRMLVITYGGMLSVYFVLFSSVVFTVFIVK